MNCVMDDERKTHNNNIRALESSISIKIVAASPGMHVSPANYSYGSVTDGQTDGRTDRQTTDKVIPMCRYASQATQKLLHFDRQLISLLVACNLTL